ncbi:EF-Tu/IF-2/RF-3 family GTPase [Litorihabitans aurantiacus]|nr:EF-Tu/IF-2/RF-3 family GTPase [Litorihabitans aurantiacus]
MSFTPGGDPRIPNQTPIPPILGGYGSADSVAGTSPAFSSDPADVKQRADDRNRVFVRTALINAPVIAVAVVVGIVLGLPTPETGVWVVVAAALVTGIHMTVVVMRMARPSTASRTGDAPPSPPPGSAFTSVRDAPVEDVTDAPVGEPAAEIIGTARLQVEDVFTITGRGLVVTGTVSSGTFAAGRDAEIHRDGVVVARTRITAIEAFRRRTETAHEGENVGLLLAGLTRRDVARDDVVVA